LKLVIGHDEIVGRWVSEKIGTVFYQPIATIGWVDARGDLVGGCAFHNYEIANIDLAVATTRPVTRGVIRAICHYVFVQLGCERITIRMRRSNKRGIKSAHKLGFVFEATLEKWFAPENGVQLKMMRSNCKWI
jgi:RimJ/RimL family protein N-acetyltransferase